MFEAVLDVLFPIVFLSVPTLAAIYLAGFVFGKAETVAAVKVVGVVLAKGLLNVGRRFQRAAISFVTDGDDSSPTARFHSAREFDVVHARIANVLDRLDDIENRLDSGWEDPASEFVETSAPF